MEITPCIPNKDERVKHKRKMKGNRDEQNLTRKNCSKRGRHRQSEILLKVARKKDTNMEIPQ